MPLKNETLNFSIYPVPMAWDTYLRQANGTYVYIGSGGPTANNRYLVRNYRSRTWETIVGWRAFLDANGYLPTNYYRDSLEYWQSEPSHEPTYCYGGTYRVNHNGEYPYVPGLSLYDTTHSPSESQVNAMVLDAKYKALSKARDLQVHVPVMFAEGRKTLDMLGDTVRKLGRAYSAFRRRRFRKAAEILGIDKPVGFAANNWLAYQLGWRPTLSDAAGLVEMAGRSVTDASIQVLRSAKAKVFDKMKVNYQTIGQGSYILPGGATTHIGETNTTVKAGLVFQLTTKGQTLAAQMGTGRYDPISTLWEVVPFSFVFDYFVDVGGWLENLSALDTMAVKAGYISVKIDRVMTSTITDHGGSPSWNAVAPKALSRCYWYERKTWEPTLADAPSLRTPLFDGLNARRLTNIAALYQQLCRGDRVNGRYPFR